MFVVISAVIFLSLMFDHNTTLVFEILNCLVDWKTLLTTRQTDRHCSHLNGIVNKQWNT